MPIVEALVSMSFVTVSFVLIWRLAPSGNSLRNWRSLSSKMHIQEWLFDGPERRAVFDHLGKSLIINSFQLLPKDVGADGRFIIPFEHSFNEFFPVQPIRVLPLCEVESEVFSVAGEKEYRSGKPILIPDSIRSTVGFHFPSPIHDLFQICSSKGWGSDI